MNRQPPQHGSPSRYRGSKTHAACRCERCRREERRRAKMRAVRRLEGSPYLVAPQKARRHVQALIRSGRTITAICADSGVDHRTVTGLLACKTKTIWPSTEARLLAVQPGDDLTAVVDATGTVRRLRALVAMGHPQQVLSEEVGVAFTYISMLTHGRRASVTLSTERAVRRVYDRLAMTAGPSKRGTALAAKYGWVPPLAWDDDTIDDPDAVPVVDIPVTAGDPAEVAARWVAGEFVVLGRDSRREAIRLLFETTDLAPEEIGGRLEMSTEAVLVAWKRIQERAAEEGRVVPLRRDLVDEQTRDEMESAA